MPGYLRYELTGKPYQKSSFLHCDIMMLQDRLKGVRLGSPSLLSRDRHCVHFNLWIKGVVGKYSEGSGLKDAKIINYFSADCRC